MIPAEGSIQLGVLPAFSGDYELLGLRFIDASGNTFNADYSKVDSVSGWWKISTPDQSKKETWPTAEIRLKNGDSMYLPVKEIGGLTHNLVTAIPIGSAEELNAIRGGSNYPLGWYYIQYADINMSAYSSWRPIGSEITREPFNGIYDGGGKFIQNLKIRGNDKRAGLFGGLGRGGVIKNIRMLNTALTGGSTMGGICGESNGTILNCSVSGSISGADSVGGIVGYLFAESELADCSFIGNLTGNRQVGGIVGLSEGRVIKGSVNMGTITGKEFVGGIIGESREKDSAISSCANNGEVRGNSALGGIAGKITGGTITRCTNTAKIPGVEQAGGIAGYSESVTIKGCDNSGAVEVSRDGGGGIAGWTKNSSIIASRNTAPVTAKNNHSGGVIGFNNDSNVTACYNTGAIISKEYAGGIIGWNEGKGNISACYSTGTVKCKTQAAGIICNNTKATGRVIACYFPYIQGGSNGYAGIGLPGSMTNAKPFGDTYYIPYDPWPRVSTGYEWGTGDGSGPSKWWKDLGSWNNGNNPVYPTLYWE
jgi:hypothetical protein